MRNSIIRGKLDEEGNEEKLRKKLLKKELESERFAAEEEMVVGGYTRSQKWGYVRIIAGTLLGGALGFYVMHRLELSYKEVVKERLRKYEIELKRKERLESEFIDPSLDS